MRRVPIQISMAKRDHNSVETVALCNDGTIWQLTGHSQWVEMPGIPQDESKDPLAKLYSQNVDLNEQVIAAKGKLDKLADLAITCVGVTGQHRWADAHRTIGDSMAKILEIEPD